MKENNNLTALMSLARKFNYNITHGLGAIPSSGDYSVMIEYLRKPTSKKLASAVRQLRDSLICGKSVGELSTCIEEILAFDNSGKVGRDAMEACRRHLNNKALFNPHTRKLHAERLKCCKGRALKNVDLHLENATVSHKVRRIVEKRMSQSVHRSFKDRAHSGRCAFMKRHAVQYELGTLGIIDDLQLKNREKSTHWSRVYSERLGRKILVPKRGYSTWQKALDAMHQVLSSKPDDKRPMAVYYCPHCGQYHFGHCDNPNAVA